MKLKTLCLLLALNLIPASATIAAEDDGFVPLFDGKTLDGWRQLGGEAKYEAVDGTIVGSSVPNTSNSFLCTEKYYGDFVLELEFKVDPKLNSGVQIRSSSYPDYHKGRVHGYQVEIDPSDRAWSAGIYDESRRGWLANLKDNEPARKAFKPDDWNHYRIEAIGDRIRTWINDVPAADLRDSMTPIGFIGLQVHGVGGRTDPLTVRWRDIRIKDLGGAMFDGRSLAGWHTIPGGKWEVKDKVILGTSARTEGRHGLLVSDKKYKNFTVKLDFKATKGNSGLYFRAEKVPGSVGVHGFQAEIDATADVGGLYETGGRAWVAHPTPEQVKKYFKPGDWNQMTVTADGRHIVVEVNGHKTAELNDDPGRTEGHIALQMHGGQDMHVEFRNILIDVKPAK